MSEPRCWVYGVVDHVVASRRAWSSPSSRHHRGQLLGGLQSRTQAPETIPGGVICRAWQQSGIELGGEAQHCGQGAETARATTVSLRPHSSCEGGSTIAWLGAKQTESGPRYLRRWVSSGEVRLLHQLQRCFSPVVARLAGGTCCTVTGAPSFGATSLRVRQCKVDRNRGILQLISREGWRWTLRPHHQCDDAKASSTHAVRQQTGHHTRILAEQQKTLCGRALVYLMPRARAQPSG
ncbi:hypothetical protein NDU88_006717 [Pleurodeles waltl]|uniref:Uncharacterized protein n=1 Tax=Pleurodeles waltl TaxID=8319 RepID=A0AAV7ME86_PLEWA|nr:hypothetical protein NDU88_006717 [Pleurodeles waltl]